MKMPGPLSRHTAGVNVKTDEIKVEIGFAVLRESFETVLILCQC